MPTVMGTRGGLVQKAGFEASSPGCRTRKALQGLAAGDVLVVECTDPLAALDIPNLLQETRDLLEGQESNDGVLVFRIRRAERPPQA